MKYIITQINKCLFIDNGQGLSIVDTGSPLSFHVDGKISLDNVDYKVPTNLLKVDSNYLSSHFGRRVSGLIGMDIINRTPVIISLYDMCPVVTFGIEPTGFHQLDSFMLMGAPGIMVTINDAQQRLLVDTGASISYLKSTLLTGRQSVGIKRDFSPLIGEESFETELFRVPCEIGSELNVTQFNVNFGKMPQGLESQLTMLGVDGILGYSLFKKYHVAIYRHNIWLMNLSINSKRP